MSGGDPSGLTVSLRLQFGNQAVQVFEDVLVQATSISLADFLDGALKDLEVGIVYMQNYTISCVNVYVCK